VGSQLTGPAALRVALLACALLGVVAAGAPAAGAATARPLQTAIADHGELDAPEADGALLRAKAAGVTVYRTMLRWYEVAPVERPPGFEAENPADPAYNWAAFDLKIRRIVAHGIEPLVTVNYPPIWAGGGYAPTPDPAEFGRFMKAVATRYSGSFGGLPRVRLWQLWNEPNVNLFLEWTSHPDTPQSPALYRQLVNQGAAAVKAVHADNVVVAGGLSPFGTTIEQADGRAALAPLRFMRDLLCLSNGSPPTPTCSDPIAFDVWSVHPYTRGGPTHRSESPDDNSLGDLPRVKQLLDAGVRTGHVRSTGAVRTWVTEFSWDTSPPDPAALPMPLHARWTAEALYRMWAAGVSLVTWLRLRDGPYPEDPTQAGLWFDGGASLSCDAPKLSRTAFGFPFVALKQPRGALVWLRTPTNRAGPVVVEQLSGKKWKRVASVRADRYGVVLRSLKLKAARGSFSISQSWTRSYSQVVACDGPRSYWRLGDAAGQPAKDELGAQNGAWERGAAAAAPGAIPADAANGAASLAGGESRVSLGVVGYVRTVELWLKTTAADEVAAFSNRNAESHFIEVGVRDGKAHVFDTASLLGSTAVNNGRWHHVVYTYDGGTGRLYVDGTLQASASYDRIDGGGPAYVGYDAALGRYFPGSVDEVAVYPQPLSDAQVKEHYDAAAKKLTFTQRTPFNGPYLRARAGKSASLPFSLVYVKDRPVKPFG
jgi:Concanavalin A-like lectin/glucanases superfamily